MRPIRTLSTAEISPLDPAYLFRIVGHFEYSHFIEHFEKLTKLSSKQELEQIDEYIKSRDEFAVYINLSRQSKCGPSILDDKPQNTNDKFERRGLAWITALARIELAAMQTGFSDSGNAFKTDQLAGEELESYGTLLLDAIRSHYCGIGSQTDFWKTAPSELAELPYLKRALANARRIYVTLAMMNTYKQFHGRHNDAQRQLLLKWESDLSLTLMRLMKFFDGLMQSQVFIKKEDYQTFIKGCAFMKSGMEQDLKNGQLQIFTNRGEVTGSGQPNAR